MPSTPVAMPLKSAILELRRELEGLPSSKRLSFDDTEAIFSMAYNLIGQGRHADALNYFSLLTLYRPTEPRYLSGLAICYQMMGCYDQAIGSFAFAANLAPEKPDYMLSIAECELLKKDCAAARETLATVVDFCQGNGDLEPARLRAEGMLALMPQGDGPAPD